MRPRRFLPLVFFPAMGLSMVSFAAPDGGVVAAGDARISQSGATTLITQNSSKAIINWQNFSIGNGETVRFAQPDGSAVVLNRVTGSTPSSIAGLLTANGNVFLLNPNGIVFGTGSQVNVGGLVASTHGLSDDDFMAGRYQFSGKDGGTGSVINQGTLTAAEGGYIALLAPQVSNQGIISARLGTVLLAGSDAITLNFGPDGSLGYIVSRGAINALVENHQMIVADGGQVFMTAMAANSLTQAVVLQDGVIEARTLDNRQGTIRLLGDMNNGRVQLSGTLDASGDSSVATSHGGMIETSAAHVSIADSAHVTTSGPGGTGQWLIDPNDYTIATTGGDITPTQLASQLALNNIVIVSDQGLTAGNGDIFVNNALNWTSGNSLTLNAVRHIQINAAITNSSGGSLVLRSDLNGSGTGNVVFGAAGSIALAGGGRTDLYYNPVTYAGFDYSGKISGPYTAWMLVNTALNLQNISTNLYGSYALGTDIDASATSSWNSNKGFATIANFYGVLDGLGHTISGFTINRADTDTIGLIGVNQGTVKNLNLASVSFTARNNAGVLAATNFGTISNVSVAGTVNVAASSAGLVSNNKNTGTITNSSFNGTITGSSFVIGGLVSYNNGTISNSSVSGSATAGTDTVGGIAASNNTTGVISNSQSTMTVSSVNSNTVGGLVGTNAGQILNSTASGNVTGTSGTVGGLAGKNTGTISDSSFQNATVTAHDTAGGLVGSNTGTILRSWSKNVTVSGNNSLGGLVGINDTTGVISGSYSSATVSTNGSSGGFVGNNKGMISDSYATGAANSSSGAQMGGFAGNNNGTLSGVYATGDVTDAFQMGALVGENKGTVAQSYATGNVTGTGGNLGGVVGQNDAGGVVTTSYATGTIKGTSNIGGVVGDNSGTVSNSYSNATVIATQASAGGIIGYNEAAGAVTTSYANNTVSSPMALGGVIGKNLGSSSSLYWNTTTSGIAVSVGSGAASGTGLTNAQFTSSANFSGFDFVNYWRLYEGHTVPLIKALLTPLVVTAASLGKTYDGTGYSGALTGATYSVADATTSGHLLGISTAYATGKNAGTYAADLYTDGQNGYDISYVGSVYTISKAVLSITTTAADKVYDSNTTASVALADNRLSGDALTISSTSATFDNKNVGTGKTVTTSGITLSGADAANYTWNTSSTTTASISQAALSLTGAAAASKVYDGTLTTSVSGTLTGLFSGDAVSIANGVFTDKNVATGKAVSVALSGADLANYSFTAPVLTANISARALNIGVTVADKVYDGNTTASVTLSDNRLSGDNLVISIGSANFNTSDVGTGKLVTAGPVTLSGADRLNYIYASTLQAQGAILPPPSSPPPAEPLANNATTALATKSMPVTGAIANSATTDSAQTRNNTVTPPSSETGSDRKNILIQDLRTCATLSGNGPTEACKPSKYLMRELSLSVTSPNTVMVGP